MRPESRGDERSAALIWPAGVMLVLWLAVAFMSGMPRLHELCHEDASSPAHECVFTLVGKGQVLTACLASPVLMPPQAVRWEPGDPAPLLLPAPKLQCALCRAPPVLPVGVPVQVGAG